MTPLGVLADMVFHVSFAYFMLFGQFYPFKHPSLSGSAWDGKEAAHCGVGVRMSFSWETLPRGLAAFDLRPICLTQQASS